VGQRRVLGRSIRPPRPSTLQGGFLIDFIGYLKDRIEGRAPKGARRSKGWRKVRKAHLKTHSECAVCVCGGKKSLQIHRS
jgi:hypothetical protein